ncbi:thioredoxin [Sulfurimonas sp. HSL-3221]|uniref:Thioredoxin n=1 Tax=Sulfurimonas diazotrophicus TaxID=3131939 RepID=A0ABZ3H7B3_9BACT|nr:thioredoxin [Sulfurimonas sp. HSL-3221]UFS61559.1 thioredoxin [Sulfurimonas sp. HSL-3221]
MALMALTEENFEKTIADNEIVIIDFWATWCGPCKQYGPIFERIAENVTDITFAKINTDEQQQLAAQFQIRSIPTTVVMKDEIVVFQQEGVLFHEKLLDIAEKAQALDMDMVRETIAKQEAAAQQ